MSNTEFLNVGHISGVFGVKGWVRVFSYTDPLDNILDYSPWTLKKGNESKLVKVVRGKIQGKSVLAAIDGVIDREQAALLAGSEIWIEQAILPKAQAGEYYWFDLLGLSVENTQGVLLGVVDSMMETGANDVLIVKGDIDRAIPFLQGQTVLNIDLDAGLIQVDWDPDF